jgi:hypothetical protein
MGMAKNSNKKPDKRVMSQKMKIERQNKYLNALPRNRYHIGNTCKETGISRKTYYTWLYDDPKFAKAIEKMRDNEVDLIEDAFRDLVEEKNPRLLCLG